MIVQVVEVCSAPSEIGDWNYCCSLNQHRSQWKLGIYLYHGGWPGPLMGKETEVTEPSKWQAHIIHCISTAWSSAVLTIVIHLEDSLQSCQWIVEYLISPWLLAPTGFENLHLQGTYMLNVHLLLSFKCVAQFIPVQILWKMEWNSLSVGVSATWLKTGCALMVLMLDHGKVKSWFICLKYTLIWYFLLETSILPSIF